LFILGVTATGLISINVSLTGFCPVGNMLRRLGFTPMLGSAKSPRWYFLQIDRWYLERRIYLVVGINISIASILVLIMSPWWMLFIVFGGGAMVWLVLTGYASWLMLWLGAEPRLNPEHMPSARCGDCAVSGGVRQQSSRNTSVTRSPKPNRHSGVLQTRGPGGLLPKGYMLGKVPARLT
jgi:hypothetical protein